MRIEVFGTADRLATGAADLLAELLNEGAATFGLAGGSTPRAAYAELQYLDVPWQDITCWLSDERWVPPEDPEANAFMVRRTLLDHVPGRFVAPDTTLEDPHIAASVYETLLEDEFVDGPDVVLLGVGDDGHTASLFPGTEALNVDRAGFVANWVPRLDTWRLTATIPLLHRAKHIVFLVAGASKADVVRSVLIDDDPLPSGLVSRGAFDATWLLDRAAASTL